MDWTNNLCKYSWQTYSIRKTFAKMGGYVATCRFPFLVAKQIENMVSSKWNSWLNTLMKTVNALIDHTHSHDLRANAKIYFLIKCIKQTKWTKKNTLTTATTKCTTNGQHGNITANAHDSRKSRLGNICAHLSVNNILNILTCGRFSTRRFDLLVRFRLLAISCCFFLCLKFSEYKRYLCPSMVWCVHCLVRQNTLVEFRKIDAHCL